MASIDKRPDGGEQSAMETLDTYGTPTAIPGPTATTRPATPWTRYCHHDAATA
jgi:hypothetical protein